MSAIAPISHDEQLGMGLGTIVHEGDILDPDSAVVMAEERSRISGRAQYDKQDRPIISYKQYLDLSSGNADMSKYALRVTHPKRNGYWTIQSSKLQRWWGLGYRPVGWSPELQVRIDAVKAKLGRRHIDDHPVPIGELLNLPEVVAEAPVKEAETPKRAVQAQDDVVVFFCNEKYPDCKRFFDTRRGLTRHWRLDHEKIKRRGAVEETDED